MKSEKEVRTELARRQKYIASHVGEDTDHHIGFLSALMWVLSTTNDKPNCPSCGKPMKNAVDSITKKLSKYEWKCDCTPTVKLSYLSSCAVCNDGVMAKIRGPKIGD